MDLEQDHKEYYDFIKSYKDDFKVIDKKTKKEWELNSINRSAKGLKDSLEIVSVLAAELDDSDYWEPKKRVHLSKNTILDMITIGKVYCDFLCLDKDNAVWDICMDPREATMLAPNFKDWKIEVLSSEGISEDETLKNMILGKWAVSNGEVFTFLEENKCELQSDDHTFKFGWSPILRKQKKYIILTDRHNRDQNCHIKKLDDQNLHFVMYDEKMVCTKVSD